MPEGAEGPQSSQTEQRSTPVQKQETGQNQNTEVRLEKPGSDENREVAEQEKQMVENVQKLREHLVKFEDYNPNIPLSQETIQKLNKANEMTSDAHQFSMLWGVFTGLGMAASEAANYFYGQGIPPGTSAAAIGAIGGFMIGAVEYPSMFIKDLKYGNEIRRMNKGYEKLKGFMQKAKGTGKEEAQPSQTETVGNKS